MRKKTGRILAACLGALLLFVCWLIWSPVQGVPVLEYHMTGDDALPDELPYIVPQADLAAQLDYLQAAGYTTITMRDYLAARQGEYTLPAKPVILTFDDGYEDNYTVLLPELEQRGMCATVYVVTNDVGLDRYLTWAQLQDMQRHGIEIGGHTADHLPLTTLAPEEQERQLRLSRQLMEMYGLQAVVSFSYPNGAYDEAIAQRVREAGYQTAVTGDAGLNQPDTNPYELQRINVAHPRFGLTEFRLRLLKGEIMTKLHWHQHKI